VRRGQFLPFLPLLLIACAHRPVVVKAPLPEPSAALRDAGVVWVAPAIDRRDGERTPERDPRDLGWRRNNVGSGQRPVRLDRPVAEWATERLVAVLAIHGLTARILAPGAQPPAVWLQPTVEKLELGVGTDDRLTSAVSLALFRGDAAAPVWQQTAHRDHTKFTGVGGTAMAHLTLLMQEEIDGLWDELLRALGSRPAAPASPATGALQIDTTPAGAHVYVDGAYYGTTPFHVDLPPGVHAVRLELPPHPAVEQRMGIVAGRTTAFAVDLSQPSQ
jgi:hypothetical protein